ncbi:hypothetical protein A2Z22_03775 [Candidatus Woesebacteria bacterium RBG_16_34_12]|uniref:DUF5667 domain-containing protein n=1 Tax=Candidatus Woesebacteria bacterium RBG_16_34_12 TaxID=1802480 RepID=A0A1F7X862_9BACT|nr:MAG: hypothetical protein A2Z22_03775 [Candidatus Woesebacteria bacterium RBG_16_34_12]
MKKIFAIVTTLILTINLLLPVSAFAQTPAEVSLNPNVKCELLEQKLEHKINNWKTRKEAKVERWERIKEHINAVIEKLRAKGYDVTPLEEDKVIMQGLIDEMQVAFDNVIAKASEAKANACSDKEAFKTNLEELKVLIQEAKAQWQELTGFMKNEFIPDIKSYKDITPTPTP